MQIGQQYDMFFHGKLNRLDQNYSAYLKPCYHMVVRSIGLSLPQYTDIRMKPVHDNSGQYCVVVQGIDQTTGSNCKKIYIYSKKEYILYAWYWSMAYLCVLDNTYGKYI